MLKKNESIYDRVIRVMIALVLFYVAYYQAIGIAQIVLYVLALVSLITGIIGYCHLYSILKFSTLKSDNKETNKEGDL